MVELENKIWVDIACSSVQVHAYVKWHCGGVSHEKLRWQPWPTYSTVPLNCCSRELDAATASGHRFSQWILLDSVLLSISGFWFEVWEGYILLAECKSDDCILIRREAGNEPDTFSFYRCSNAWLREVGVC